MKARTCTISRGPDGDKDSPVAAIVWLNSGPGDPLRGRHAHSCDAINLVVQGGMYMDGIWLRPGQAKIVPADTNYGDATVSGRSEEHTSELQSLMRISYAVFCLNKKTQKNL